MAGFLWPKYLDHSNLRVLCSRAPAGVRLPLTDNLDEKSLRVLNLLIEDPGYTAVTISDRLSLSRKTISSCIKKLKDRGFIERVGSDRKGYWKILV